MAEHLFNKKEEGNVNSNGSVSSLNKNFPEESSVEIPVPDADEGRSPDESDATVDKYAKDWKLEFFALIGFCVSGVIFILSGIQSGDVLTIVGSTVWMAACIVWMVPYRKYFANPEE